MILVYFLRRLGGAFATWVLIVLLSFVLIRLSPGSPLGSEKAVSAEVKATLSRRYQLDQSIVAQCIQYARNLCHGDLGMSWKYTRHSVSGLLKEAMPATLILGAFALAWSIPLGLASGLFVAGLPSTLCARLIFLVSGILAGVPSFVLGPLLILVFALGLHLVPAAGWGEARHLPLPVLALGAGYWAQTTRLCRAGVLGALSEDYMRFARAKGLPIGYCLHTHAIWAGLRPVVAFLGPAAASVLTGSVVVEKLFFVPGIGTFFVDAALNRDYPLVMGIVIVSSGLLLLFQIGADMLLAFIDPRVRLE